MELQACGRFDWERVLRRCRIPQSTKYVAMVLGTYADADGTRVRPGAARLAAVCGMGESTVRRHVDALLKLGLVERLANGGGPARLAAVYRLTVPDDLLDRVELLGPDESPLTQVSGDRPVDNRVGLPVDNGTTPLTLLSVVSGQGFSELRSLPEVTPLISGGNSAHPGERPPHDQPHDQPLTALSASPHQRAICAHGNPSGFLGSGRTGTLACGECRRGSPPSAVTSAAHAAQDGPPGPDVLTGS